MAQVVDHGHGQVARFHNSYIINNQTGCWEWQLTLNKDGYGRCYFDNITFRAHRLSYKLKFGDPGNKYVLHKCDNAKCVNPNHLYLGCQQDNMKDKKDRGRSLGINRGHANGSSKLTDKDVKEIIDLLQCKLFSQKFIGQKYNVGQDQISRIKTGDRWNWLDK